MVPKQILILEDDEHTAEGYAEGLRLAGHSVVTCTRFEEAREHLARFTPDILLTDVRVGEFNGLYLALLFRKASPTGRVIVISGYDDPVIRSESARMEAEFLLKPITVSELAKHL